MKTRTLAGAFLLILLFHLAGTAQDIQWADQYGNGVATASVGLKTDATGVYTAGRVFSAGKYDAYLRKYDFAGNALWTRQLGIPAFDFADGVATDSTGVYLLGDTPGVLPGQTSAGSSDAFVRKYGSNGNVLWTQQFGTAGIELPMGIASHSTGVYVAGETTGTFPGAVAGNGKDIFIARMDAQAGQLLWVRQFGIRAPDLLGIGGVAVDDTGVYAAGIARAGLARAALLRKFDFSGNLVWARELDGTQGCSATIWGLATHDNSELYVVGQWTDSFFNDPVNCPAGGSEVVGVVLKYDSLGNLLWRRRLKGAGEGNSAFTGAKVISASASGVYVGANLTTSFPGQVVNAPRSDRSECKGLTPGNNFYDKLDAYVRRYDFDGNVIWTHQFGSNVFDLVSGIDANATGVYAAADTSCEIVSSETFSGGDGDASVLRFSIDPTSPSGQIQFIVGRLETLNDAGRFNAGEFNSLVKQLEAALLAINQGNNVAARQELQTFTGTVILLGNRGVLTTAEANALIALANAVSGNL